MGQCKSNSITNIGHVPNSLKNLNTVHNKAAILGGSHFCEKFKSTIMWSVVPNCIYYHEQMITIKN